MNMDLQKIYVEHINGMAFGWAEAHSRWEGDCSCGKTKVIGWCFSSVPQSGSCLECTVKNIYRSDAVHQSIAYELGAHFDIDEMDLKYPRLFQKLFGHTLNVYTDLLLWQWVCAGDYNKERAN